MTFLCDDCLMNYPGVVLHRAQTGPHCCRNCGKPAVIYTEWQEMSADGLIKPGKISAAAAVMADIELIRSNYEDAVRAGKPVFMHGISEVGSTGVIDVDTAYLNIGTKVVHGGTEINLPHPRKCTDPYFRKLRAMDDDDLRYELSEEGASRWRSAYEEACRDSKEDVEALDRCRDLLRKASIAIDAFMDPDGNPPEDTGEFRDLKVVGLEIGRSLRPGSKVPTKEDFEITRSTLYWMGMIGCKEGVRDQSPIHESYRLACRYLDSIMVDGAGGSDESNPKP
jgi:hypothetical protein